MTKRYKSVEWIPGYLPVQQKMFGTAIRAALSNASDFDGDVLSLVDATAGTGGRLGGEATTVDIAINEIVSREAQGSTNLVLIERSLDSCTELLGRIKESGVPCQIHPCDYREAIPAIVREDIHGLLYMDLCQGLPYSLLKSLSEVEIDVDTVIHFSASKCKSGGQQLYNNLMSLGFRVMRISPAHLNTQWMFMYLSMHARPGVIRCMKEAGFLTAKEDSGRLRPLFRKSEMPEWLLPINTVAVRGNSPF